MIIYRMWIWKVSFACLMLCEYYDHHKIDGNYEDFLYLGVNQWPSQYGGKGGRVPSLTAKKLPKRGKKLGKWGKKSGRKGKNREGSFTLPLLTDRAGFATGVNVIPLMWAYRHRHRHLHPAYPTHCTALHLYYVRFCTHSFYINSRCKEVHLFDDDQR